VGGYTDSGSSAVVEVVSLDLETNPVPNCLEELNSFPTTVEGATGAVLGAGKLCYLDKYIFHVCQTLFFQMLLLTSAEAIKAALVLSTSALNTILTLTPGMAFVKLM
jgi:hypothetical protein